MDLTFSDEQRMLAESARTFVERSCPPARVRAVQDEPSGLDRELWAAMAGLGWSGIAIGEDVGGGGRGILELAVVGEALGRGPVPSPLLLSTALAALPLAWGGTASQRERWLPALAAGDATGTLAAVEPGGRDELDPPRMEGVHLLSGTKVLVPWAATAAVVLVTTAGGVFLVEPADQTVLIERHHDLSGDPLFSLDLRAATAEPLGNGGAAQQQDVVERAIDCAAVLQLAYMVGAAERVLEMTVEHALTREQFGRPIGSFQAVAHRCVDIRIDVDACRYLAYRAAWAIDIGEAAGLAVGAAKSYGNEAMRRIFMNAHQVHGAIGFSTEHDLHLFTRRAKAFELTYGTTARHADRVATAMGLT